MKIASEFGDSIADKKVGAAKVKSQSYTVYDLGPVTPKVIRRGVASIGEAKLIVDEYLRYNNGPCSVVETKTEYRVARRFTPVRGHVAE